MGKQRLFGLMLLCVFCSIELCTADLASESAVNTAEMTFYQLSTGDFQEKQAAFKQLIVDRLKEYCNVLNHDCYLTNGADSSQFATGNVVFSSGYPEKSGRQTIVKLYVTYPTGISKLAGALDFVLKQSTVEALTDGLKDEFEALYDTIIISMNGFFHGKPSSTTANKIIIPIAFAIVIAVCCVAVVLHFYGKRREKNRKRNQVKQTSKVSPGYKKVDEQQQYKNNFQQAHGQSKDDWYADKQTRQRGEKQNDLGRDSSKTRENMDSDDNQWYEERKREKKEKKKKKKKKKHHRQEQEGEDNAAYTTGTNDNLIKAEQVPPTAAEYNVPETTEL